MAPVRMPDEIGIVLVEPRMLAFEEPLIAPAPAFGEDTLARTVLRDDLTQGGALRRRVLRMRVIVVEAGAIGENEIAFDLFKGERAILVDFEISGLVGVLQKLRRAKAAGVLMWILEIVVPLHGCSVIGVRTHDLDRFPDDVEGIHAIDRYPVLRFDAENAFHVSSQRSAVRAK